MLPELSSQVSLKHHSRSLQSPLLRNGRHHIPVIHPNPRMTFTPRDKRLITHGYVSGTLIDRNYKATTREIGHTIDRECGDDLRHFPIEKTRTRGSLAILTGTLIGYGWALEHRNHVSIPHLLQCIQGFLGTSIYTIFNIVWVDLLAESPSTTVVVALISRCTLAASDVAAARPLGGIVGREWYYTALPAVVTGGIGSVVVWMTRKWGAKWRHERVVKTTRACRKDDAGEAGLKDQGTLPGF